MNSAVVNIENYLKINVLFEGLAGLFRKFPAVYVYDITPEGRYSLEIDPWSNMPSVDVDIFKAGTDISVKVIDGKIGLTLKFVVKRINFLLTDIRHHREVVLDNSSSYIFRSGERWLVFMGSKHENRNDVTTDLELSFAAMHKKKKS